MTLDEFNTHCSNLTAATKVVQWGGSHVWKVGGKIFAISELGTGPDKADNGDEQAVSMAFKVSETSYQMLSELEGVGPAPYLARAKWVRVDADAALSDDDRKIYLSEAHRLIANRLTKKLKADLGLLL